MGREVWGVYGVRDHLREHAFLADVMLYDRVVLPIPPGPESPESPVEWTRWREEGWAPEVQRELLGVLGDLAYPVPWGAARRQQWAREWAAAQTAQESTSPWIVTGGVLVRGLPAHVTGVNAVATYRSQEELERAVGLSEVTESTAMPPGQLLVVLGREFLVPDPADYQSGADALRSAVELASDRDFRRKRSSFWRWQREFIRDGFTDPAAINAAVEEMQDLLADEQRAVRQQKVKSLTLFAFCITSAAATLAGGPFSPLALGAAFLSVGQFGAERFFASQTQQQSPAALFFDARKHMGWH